MAPNEAQTRKLLIDRQIAKAGWNLRDSTQVGFEIPASGDTEDWTDGITDYSLYLLNREIISIVEAKRQSRSPQVAREQAEDYAKRIEQNQSFRPFVFLANGTGILFWDTEEGTPREVAGFFSREDLKNLLIEQGIDPDHIDYSGTDIEKKVSDKDMLRKQWTEIWDVCLQDESGQLPGKQLSLPSCRRTQKDGCLSLKKCFRN